jgi:hypothetical protein
MKQINPFLFFLPGIFLLVLGLGNLGVGSYKASQYDVVVSELQQREFMTTSLVNASPLRRIQLAQQGANRLFQRMNEAKDRRSFYHLVSFGGKAFMLLGMCLVFVGTYTQVLRNK